MGTLRGGGDTQTLPDVIENIEIFHSRGGGNAKAFMPASSTPISIPIFCCRALLGQVEELSIYCGYGLTWSQEKREFLPDSTGCPEIIKIGNYMSCSYVTESNKNE